MIEIKFAFTTIAEAAAFMAQCNVEAPGKPVPEVSVKPDPKPEVKTSAKKPEASAPPAPAANPVASPPTAATAPTAAPAVEPVTYEKSGLAVKISQAAAKDKPATVALLAKFGVSKGPTLKPEHFDAFGAEIDALLAGGGDLS